MWETICSVGCSSRHKLIMSFVLFAFCLRPVCYVICIWVRPWFLYFSCMGALPSSFYMFWGQQGPIWQNSGTRKLNNHANVNLTNHFWGRFGIHLRDLRHQHLYWFLFMFCLLDPLGDKRMPMGVILDRLSGTGAHVKMMFLCTQGHYFERWWGSQEISREALCAQCFPTCFLEQLVDIFLIIWLPNVHGRCLGTTFGSLLKCVFGSIFVLVVLISILGGRRQGQGAAGGCPPFVEAGEGRLPYIDG